MKIEAGDLTYNALGVGFGMLLERLEFWLSASRRQRGMGEGDNAE